MSIRNVCAYLSIFQTVSFSLTLQQISQAKKALSEAYCKSAAMVYFSPFDEKQHQHL